jgi:hypothetical protein
MWVYVIAFLFGPIAAFATVLLLVHIVDLVFGALANFEHWWAIGLVALYVVCGGVCVGVLNAYLEPRDE